MKKQQAIINYEDIIDVANSLVDNKSTRPKITAENIIHAIHILSFDNNNALIWSLIWLPSEYVFEYFESIDTSNSSKKYKLWFVNNFDEDFSFLNILKISLSKSPVAFKDFLKSKGINITKIIKKIEKIWINFSKSPVKIFDFFCILVESFDKIWLKIDDLREMDLEAFGFENNINEIENMLDGNINFIKLWDDFIDGLT